MCAYVCVSEDLYGCVSKAGRPHIGWQRRTVWLRHILFVPLWVDVSTTRKSRAGVRRVAFGVPSREIEHTLASCPIWGKTLGEVVQTAQLRADGRVCRLAATRPVLAVGAARVRVLDATCPPRPWRRLRPHSASQSTARRRLLNQAFVPHASPSCTAGEAAERRVELPG